MRAGTGAAVAGDGVGVEQETRSVDRKHFRSVKRTFLGTAVF